MGRSRDVRWELHEWDVLRDVYVARFGQPVRVDVATDPDVDTDPPPTWEEFEALPVPDDAFYSLAFFGPDVEEGQAVYATFGAAAWTGGYELFVRSVVRYNMFNQYIQSLVREAIAPGAIADAPLGQTEFKGVLFLPMSEGSFDLPPPEGAGPRAMLRLLPLMPDEMELGRRDLNALIELLRAGDGLALADPFRGTLVGWKPGDPYWTDARLRSLAFAKRDLEEVERRQARLRELDAPAIAFESGESLIAERKAWLSFLTSHPLDVPDARRQLAERNVDLSGLIASMVAKFWDVVSEASMKDARAILEFVLVSHPHSSPLVEATTGIPAVEGAKAFARMTSLMHAIAPEIAQKEFVEAGQLAIEGMPHDRPVGPSSLWLVVARALFDALPDGPTEASPAIPRRSSRDATLASIQLGFLDDDGGDASPRERLVRAGRALVMDMHLGEQGRPPAFAGRLTGGAPDA